MCFHLYFKWVLYYGGGGGDVDAGVVDTDTRAKPENFVHYHACVFVWRIKQIACYYDPTTPISHF